MGGGVQILKQSLIDVARLFRSYNKGKEEFLSFSLQSL